jgi:DNA-binding transcriptional ArsR family regulator
LSLARAWRASVFSVRVSQRRCVWRTERTNVRLTDVSVRADASRLYSGVMATTNVDFGAVGRLLAAPARAVMLDALFDGEEWAVSDLARVARVAPSTASEHLELLRTGGLVTASRDGRYRRYRLAGVEVAEALEYLGTLAPPMPARGLSESSRNEALRLGRTCYDHLAGRLGVALTDALVERRYVSPAADDFAPTAAGVVALRTIEIDVETLRRGRRPVARSCLDWSERRPHLAGALGAALLARLDASGGLERVNGSRAVRLRRRGLELLAELDLEPEPAWLLG